MKRLDPLQLNGDGGRGVASWSLGDDKDSRHAQVMGKISRSLNAQTCVVNSL